MPVKHGRRLYDRQRPEAVNLYSSLMILLIGLGGAFLTFHWVSSEQRIRDFDQFKNRAQLVGTALERNIRKSEDVLHAVSALFASSRSVSREDFKTFVSLESRGHVGIHALEWIPRVPHAERRLYESKAQRDGLIDYQFRQLGVNGMEPAEIRKEYFPVFYVEPIIGNKRTLGFDLGSNPVRRAALEKARDSGVTVASARVSLVQGETEETGVLLVSPKYDQRDVPATLQERRSSLSGFTVSVLRIEELLSKSTEESIEHKSLAIAVFDPQDTRSQQPLHTLNIQDAQERLTVEELTREAHYESRHIIGQREWRLIVIPRTGQLHNDLPWIPWVASFASFLLPLLIGFYIQLLARRRNFAVRLVQERTRELAKSEKRAELVVKNIVDGIITIDQTGIIKSANPAAERIFDYRSHEIVGRNVNMLMPEPYHSAHDRYLAQYMKTGDAKIIGLGREVEGRRADGSTFPLDLAVAEADAEEGRLFVGIIRDISDRKAMEKLKTEFVSTVSHELRTPLTAIRGALGLVSSGATGILSKKTHDMVTLAEKNSGRLISLVNDILDLEKIQSGEMEFHFHRVNVQELMDVSAQINEPFAQEHNVRLTVETSSEQLFVRGDEERLTQVLTNLISNAVKFSPEAGEVVLRAVSDKGMARINVSDSGPGIPAAFQDRIFERFRQIDSSDSREKGGTGLGLSICRSIVEKHGGRIDVKSEEGEGSEFYFELPVIGQNGFTFETPAPDEQGDLSPLPEKPANKGIRILVLEDDPDVAAYLGVILENDGFEFDVAKSAAQALQMIERGDYKIVTVDIRLPDNQSADVIQRIRALKNPSELSIVVVSGRVKEAREEILANTVSVTEWLSKPFDRADLLNAVNRSASSMVGSNKQTSRILYVEDDPAMPIFVAELLGEKAQVDVAATQSEARRKLEQSDYDLILLDINLPDGSGYDLIDVADEKATSVPIVVFSIDDVRSDIVPRVSGVVVKSRATNQELLATILEALGHT